MDSKQLKDKYGDVKVFAINNESLNDVSLPLCDMNDFLQTNGEFILRYEAELNPNYRQIIPYCLVRCNEDYFITKRIKGDERLINQYSLGIGGHIDFNGDETDVIEKSLERELQEELDIKCNIISTQLVYMIKSNETEVDKVHLGLIYIIDVDANNIEVKEKDVLAGYWIYKDGLINFDGKLETWSRICVDKFIKTTK